MSKALSVDLRDRVIAAHKSTPIRDAIEVVGARLLFLPPYSPGLNPIENAFANRDQNRLMSFSCSP